MYETTPTRRFCRDAAKCAAKGWNVEALKEAIRRLAESDEVPLPASMRDHKLKGKLAGFRSLHVDSAPNPPRDKWVLMYTIEGGELILLRTGTHSEVYGS